MFLACSPCRLHAKPPCRLLLQLFMQSPLQAEPLQAFFCRQLQLLAIQGFGFVLSQPLQATSHDGALSAFLQREFCFLKLPSTMDGIKWDQMDPVF